MPATAISNTVLTTHTATTTTTVPTTTILPTTITYIHTDRQTDRQTVRQTYPLFKQSPKNFTMTKPRE